MDAQRAKAQTLRNLHSGPTLLILANAWDVASAKVIAGVGARAIATSSGSKR